MRAVLVERRRADRTQLAAREHRLQQVARRDGTLRGSRADDRVQLVDEQDDLALACGDLLQDGLEPLLELAPVLRARDERADVERPHALALEARRDVAGDDPLREPLGDRRLPHAGLTDQHGVVLRAPREHLDRAADLLVAPDHGVELPLLGKRRQVAAVLLERLVRALGVLRRDALPAADVLQRREQRVARNDLEREQQVLHGDELVAERLRLVERLVENAAERRAGLGLGAAAGDGGLLAKSCLGLAAELLGARAGALDERPRKLLVQQRDRQVVRCQLGVAGSPRKLLRPCHSLAALDRELVEVHGSAPRRRWLRLLVQHDVPPVLLVSQLNLVAQLTLELRHACAHPA